MIVAASLLRQCRYLLTEDFQEGTHLNDLLVVNPFATSWESLGV